MFVVLFFHEGKTEFLIKDEAHKAECGLFAGLAMGALGCPKESDRETQWHCCCTPAQLTEEFLAEF